MKHRKRVKTATDLRVSPGLIAGGGLKPFGLCPSDGYPGVSPGLIAGGGLKPQPRQTDRTGSRVSPGLITGGGLKHELTLRRYLVLPRFPPASSPGAD